MKGHVDVVAVLLEYGANVNAADAVLCTPLYDAARARSVRVLSLLVRKFLEVHNE